MRPRRWLEQLQGSGFLASVSRGAGVAFFLQLAGAGSAYLLQVFLARWMGTHEYGGYSYVIAWVTTLAILSSLGFPIASLRFVSQYRDQQDWPRLRGAVIAFLGLTVFNGTVLALAGLGVLHLTVGRDWPLWSAFVVGLWLMPLHGLLHVQSEMARSIDRVTLAQGPAKAGRPLAMLVAAALVVWVAGRLDATLAVWAALASLAVVVLLQTGTLLRALPRAIWRVRAHFELRPWMRVALPAMLASSFVLLLNQMDVLMVGWFLPQEQVGIYHAASRTAMVISFLGYAIDVVLAQRFAVYHSRGDRDGLQRLVAAMAHLSFWPTLLMTAGMVVLAPFLLSIFGAEFVDGKNVLILLSVCHLFNAAIGPVGYLLTMTGHQDDDALGLGMAAVLNFLFNALLIPHYGIFGAALATTLAWLIRGLFQWRAARKRVGVRASIVSALLIYGWRWPLRLASAEPAPGEAPSEEAED